MAATPLVAAAVAPKTEHSPPDHQRKIKSKNLSGREQRTPANKKVKLSTPVSPPVLHPGGVAMFADMPKGMRTENGCLSPDAATGRTALNTASAGQQTEFCTALSKESPKIMAIRQTLSEQFDIEILLKHRELRLIEQEIAKTQVCIEQLRRCKLIPYQSPEISLEPTPTGQKHPDIPDYAPPHWSVTNGPYTRHYKQWLLPDPRFDGYGPEGPPQTLQKGGKSLRSQGAQDPNQPYTVTGRPQRQSAVKVQQRGASTTMCTFNRSDGQLVRLECRDCHRSNFSSAQGFINHCRIAHQREYSSHDAAAYDCGVIIDENMEQPLVSPNTPVDGPSRNTRQTQPNQFKAPYPSLSSNRRSMAESKGIPDQTMPATPVTPKLVSPIATSTGQRKNGGRRAAMTTPKNQDTEKGASRLLTPPRNVKTYSTPHLEGFLKRKKIKVNLEEMVTEVKSGRIDWDDTDSEGEDESAVASGYKDENSRVDGDTPMLDLGRIPRVGLLESVKAENKPSAENTAMKVSFPRNNGATRQIVSDGSPLPLRLVMGGSATPQKDSTHKKESAPFYDRMGLDGACDSDGSSSDEDDGYKSDADEEMMEVDRPPALSSGHRASDSAANPDGPGRGQGLRQLAPLTFQAVSPPVSPTDTRETEVIQAMPVQEPVTAIAQPLSPEMSRQIRFVMPSVRRGNNLGGVLENGLVKMKFGNLGSPKKHGAFGGGIEGGKVS